ncbi:MAG: glycosyltransferase family 39 protein [Chloroflexota bacterium]
MRRAKAPRWLAPPDLWVSAAIAVLACALSAPSAARVVQLSPDMVEYVDVARRLVGGQGYVLGIKAYHLGGPEVIQDGLIHRTPLFTLIMAALLRLGFDLYAVQVVNAAFGALSAALVYAIGARLAGRTVGVAAGLLAAASPVGLAQQVQIQSDALSTALTLAGVLAVMLAAERGRLALAVMSGLFFGLGYLARPPVIVVGLAVLVLLPVLAPNRADARRLMLGLAGGMAAICLPVTAFSLVTRGRLSYSGKGYLYGVVSDADVMENGYVSMPLSPVAFVMGNPGFVVSAIGSVTGLYLRSIFLEREWLAPLMAGWPGAVMALLGGRYPWTSGIVVTAACANFVFYALTWSSWQDRFMLTTVYLLLPFVVDGLLRTIVLVASRLLGAVSSAGAQRRISVAVLGVAVAAVMAAWSPRFLEQYQGQFTYGERPVGTRVTDGVRWSGPPRWVNDGNLDDAVEWIRGQTTPDTVLALGQPWPYTFFTGRPSVLLPYRLTDERLRDFLVEYRVSYVLYDPRDPQRREYGDQLRDLSSDGVRASRLKNLQVFDTRALWR